MMRKPSTEQNRIPQSTKKQSKKTLKVVLFIALVLIWGVCAIIGYNHKTFEHHSDYEYADSDSVATDSATADIALADSAACGTNISNDDNEECIDESGVPLSTGEIEDGKGGYDNNAEGYFNMHADKYVTDNHDVYFEGNSYLCRRL